MFSFSVTGIPEPQGSARAFVVHDRITGRPRAVITSDNRDLAKWRDTVSRAAMLAMRVAGETIKEEAVELELRFFFERPKSVNKKIFHKTTRPDTDKLERAILDALTGIVYVDDAQVTDTHPKKRFGSPARVEVYIRETPIDDDLPLFRSFTTSDEVVSA